MKSIPGVSSFKTETLLKAVSCQRCQKLKRKCLRDRPSCAYCTNHGHDCQYAKRRVSDSGASGNVWNVLEAVLEFGNTGRKLLSTKSHSVSSTSSVFTDLATRSGVGEGYSSSEMLYKDQKCTLSPIDTLVDTALKMDPRIDFHLLPTGPNTGRQSLENIKARLASSPKSGLISSSLTSTSLAPPAKGFWPRQMDLDSAIDPTSRIGPVFTNILNTSLNQSGVQVAKDLSHLYSLVPNKTTADLLFARYKSSIHPIIPILDWQALCPIYEQFWNDKNSVDLDFYIQLFTIFYASSVSEFEEMTFKSGIDITEPVKKMKYYVGATEIALSMYDFPRNVSMICLQSSVILHSVLRTDCRTDDCGSIGSLIRLAQLMELNRDPMKYHGVKDENEIQLKRLLWWQIFYLDSTTSLSTRISPIIQEHEYDTLFPTEYYKDHNGVFKLNQSIAFANGKFRWIECCNKILRRSFSLQQVDQRTLDNIKESINNLSIHCQSSIERILSPSNIISSQEAFVSFSASVVSTLPDRCNILFNIVFSDSLNNGRRFDLSSVSKDDTPAAGSEITDCQIHLLNEFVKHGSMPRYCMFLWELRKFQPIQTLLSLMKTLIADLKQIHHIHNSMVNFKALRIDRKVKCINDTFDRLLYLSQHTTPLCQERWQLLFDLKTSIWEIIFGETDVDDSHSQLASPDNFLSGFKTNDEIDSDYWQDLDKELSDFQNVIDENMNIKLWDQALGHYLV